MAYTEENFQEWIFFIGFKMDYVTGKFAEKENLTLDYSIQSLDAVEAWILEHYEDHHKLIEDKEMLDSYLFMWERPSGSILGESGLST